MNHSVVESILCITAARTGGSGGLGKDPGVPFRGRDRSVGIPSDLYRLESVLL